MRGSGLKERERKRSGEDIDLTCSTTRTPFARQRSQGREPGGLSGCGAGRRREQQQQSVAKSASSCPDGAGRRSTAFPRRAYDIRELLLEFAPHDPPPHESQGRLRPVQWMCVLYQETNFLIRQHVTILVSCQSCTGDRHMVFDDYSRNARCMHDIARIARQPEQKQQQDGINMYAMRYNTTRSAGLL